MYNPPQPVSKSIEQPTDGVGKYYVGPVGHSAGRYLPTGKLSVRPVHTSSH